MFIIENYSTAVIFCVITMLCWGSWANTQKLAEGTWRFELFYWDYVIGVLLCSTIIALTLGSVGPDGRSFLQDLEQADSSSIISATIGGAVFNAANILLCAAIAIAGMSVAFPIGIGLALVIGVIVNYISAPVGNGVLIFVGVLLIVVAMLLNAGAYRKSLGSTGLSLKGLVLSIISGSLMGLFYRFVADSMFQNFVHPLPGKLSPYTAVFIFSIGLLLSNFIFNSLLMRYPLSGNRIQFSDYFRGSAKSHFMGILGGAIWCVGMCFSILASDKAGPAISYGLGQGATVVAACWGIFVWREFKAAKGVAGLLGTMIICYLLGLALIIFSR